MTTNINQRSKLGVYLGGPLNGEMLPAEALDGRSDLVFSDTQSVDGQTFKMIRYLRKDFVYENTPWIMFASYGLTDHEISLLGMQWLERSST